MFTRLWEKVFMMLQLWAKSVDNAALCLGQKVLKLLHCAWGKRCWCYCTAFGAKSVVNAALCLGQKVLVMLHCIWGKRGDAAALCLGQNVVMLLHCVWGRRCW